MEFFRIANNGGNAPLTSGNNVRVAMPLQGVLATMTIMSGSSHDKR